MMNDDNIGRSRMLPPLPERMRPHNLDGYVGQRHLIGEGCILRNMIESGSRLVMPLFSLLTRSTGSANRSRMRFLVRLKMARLC